MNVLDLLFPKRCLGCGKFGRYFCSMCQQTIKPLRYLKCPVCEKPAIDGMTHPGCKTKYSLDGLTSFFRYDGIIKEAIKYIKYRYVSYTTCELIDTIPNSFFDFFHTSYFINRTSHLVPIPLHPTRLRHRGFNQAEVIARILGKRLAISVRNNILKRIRKTTPQVEMKDRQKRLENMKDVFSVSFPFPELKKPLRQLADRECINNQQPASSKQQRGESAINNNRGIFLVDDVFTTGATLRSAASTLKHAGFPFVWGITIAQ